MSRRLLGVAVVAVGVLGGAAWTWARGEPDAMAAEATPGDARPTRTSGRDARHKVRQAARPVVLPRSDGHPAAEQSAAEKLAAFDETLGDGWERCAPELDGFARPLLEQLEDDWRALKPDLQPSWDAWGTVRGVVLDEERLRRCQETFARGACSEAAASWEECSRPFTGALALGDACEDNRQCASTTCRLGRCAPRDECQSDVDCGAGMLCVSGELGNHTCVPAPLEGETCLFDARCADDQWCDDDARCRALRRIAPGEPCDLRSDRCEAPSECLARRCAVPSRRSGILDELRGLDTWLGPCSCGDSRDGMACAHGPDGPACVPVRYAEVGEPCDDDAVLCRGLWRTTYCRKVGGTCALAGGPGDACAESEECRGQLRCVDERCAEPAGPGEPCDDGEACAFGMTCIFDLDGADQGEEVAGTCDVLPHR